MPKISINLLPKENRLQNQQARTNSKIITLCIILVCITIAIGIITAIFFTSARLELQSAKNQNSTVQSQANEFGDIDKQAQVISINIDSIKMLEEKGTDWITLLKDFNNLVPADVQVNAIKFSAMPTFTFDIAGQGSSSREVLKFVEKLKTDSIFAKAKLISLSKSPTGKNGNISFSISSEVNTSATSGAKNAD